MTKEKMENLMENHRGIGVETENGVCYFYEVFNNDFKSVIKRINGSMKHVNYKVYIAHAEEVERMLNFDDEEVVIYETTEGDVVGVLENQAIRLFKSVDSAINMCYKAGFIFE